VISHRVPINRAKNLNELLP